MMSEYEMNQLIAEGQLSQKSYASLTSQQMEEIIGAAGKRKGSMDLDPMKWKDANPSSFK
jgi:hypothetical protein